MISEDMRAKREAVVIEHFETETAQDFDKTLATFDYPHYEIMASGQVFDGSAEVMEYYKLTRTAFPDQRHENVRLHFSDDAVIAEFDLLGTNDGVFYGRPPTHKSFRVPIAAFFFFEGDKIVNERIYFDSMSLLSQIGQEEVLKTLDA
ncbi:MAG: ester cyclase [Robiginitomaculum sp.]|nr:MAG: ester cyclase [Robiginitomaculum sp.]